MKLFALLNTEAKSQPREFVSLTDRLSFAYSVSNLVVFINRAVTRIVAQLLLQYTPCRTWIKIFSVFSIDCGNH